MKSTGKRVLNLLEADKFGVNGGGGNGASCGGIKVRTDTMKLSNMVIASFGNGRNLVGEGR